MIHDLKDAQSANEKFDVCVLGSGPAGLTVALGLANRNRKVLLMEAGALTYTEESQKILECKNLGMNAWPQWKRQRFFGGTSNHWSGRCRPFEKSDFDEKGFRELPGWPIQYSEIEPYLQEAKKIVDISGKEFEPINEALLGSEFEPDAFTKSPPTRFGQKYYETIKSSKNIVCYLNANAVQLVLDEQKKNVKTVEVRNYSKQSFQFESSVFILALGGIENPRFLLNQDKQIPEGIGNSTGMVGKCFMEHLNIKIGEFIIREPITNTRYAFFTSDELVAKEGIGKSNFSLKALEQIRSFGKAAKVKTFFKQLACNLSLEDKVQFIAEFDCPGTGVITTLTEQEPNKQSYVSVGSEIDAIGMRKAILNWQLSEKDKKSIRYLGREFAKAFGDSGIGIVKLENYILDEELQLPIAPHAHHMGTTRMAESSEHGVVDKNCKVFGIENLFIAGSSIFATGGACNPTMPIIQFALRLTDHIGKVS